MKGIMLTLNRLLKPLLAINLITRSVFGLWFAISLSACDEEKTALKAFNNNESWYTLPKDPYPELRKLDRLIGEWKISSPEVEGHTTYEWMEGGFFLVQKFDLTYKGERHKGVEHTGFDAATQTLRSHLLEINGNNLTYTYDIQGDTLFYWFGDKTSKNFSKSIFNEGGNILTGAWQWIEEDGRKGGYEFTLTKTKSAPIDQ
jgi:hypothetical protein